MKNWFCFVSTNVSKLLEINCLGVESLYLKQLHIDIDCEELKYWRVNQLNLLNKLSWLKYKNKLFCKVK